MKTIKVNIQLDMEVPEDWEVVDHPDDIQAFKMTDGRYMYMSFLPMFTDSYEVGSTWSSECADELGTEIVDMVSHEDVEMKLVVN
jgi:hypothetical protein